MANEALVVLENVSRFYGEHIAVDNISFTVKRGEVLGLLGPNGAGKSTTMNMITGNLTPTEGRILINGIDILDAPKAAKAELGYLPEQPPLYADFSVDEFLLFCARINRVNKARYKTLIDAAKERCGLTQVGKRLITNLSKGFQQRVGIAQAILHAPTVVILDEPTVGLDPLQIREIRKLISELRDEHSVILSTHILPEVQTICDNVQIINKGKIILSDSIDGLRQRMKLSTLRVAFVRPPSSEQLNALDFVEQVQEIDSGVFSLHHHPGDSPAEQLVKISVNNDWGLVELIPGRLSLEDIFVDITMN